VDSEEARQAAVVASLQAQLAQVTAELNKSKTDACQALNEGHVTYCSMQEERLSNTAELLGTKIFLLFLRLVLFI